MATENSISNNSNKKKNGKNKSTSAMTAEVPEYETDRLVGWLRRRRRRCRQSMNEFLNVSVSVRVCAEMAH